MPACFRRGEEAAAWNARDADLAKQELQEIQVVIEPKRAKIRHDVVRAFGRLKLESRFAKIGKEQVAAPAIAIQQLSVVRIGHAKRGGSGDLQRVRSTDRKEVMHFSNAARDFFRRDAIPQPPTGHAKSLG